MSNSPFRPHLARMAGYVPGEQPQQGGWVKLNTNENPYPPSPAVVEAIRSAATSRLNVYPDADATPFRKAAAEVLGVDPDQILPGNGSDEILTILARSVCTPGDLLAYPYPSYVLYETLAAIQDARVERLYLDEIHGWDKDAADRLVNQCRLMFLPNPNSPLGNTWSPDVYQELLPHRGLLVLDEAYIDFAGSPSAATLLDDPRFDGRMVVTRTFSKSYSLAGIRFGFCIGFPDLLAEMRKVKDSYNCDAISIAAATAAITDQEWMRNNCQRISDSRRQLAEDLDQRGFEVTPSEANFLWVTHPTVNHRAFYEELKSRKILVRYMEFPMPNPRPSVTGLRITIGSAEELQKLLSAVDEALTVLIP